MKGGHPVRRREVLLSCAPTESTRASFSTFDRCFRNFAYVTKRTILTAVLAVVAVLRVGADVIDSPMLDFVVTPLATILVIAIAWTDPGEETDPYRRFVLAGLLFSLIGDVFLVLPGDRFLPGLASFLFAHLSYTIAFTRDGGFTGSPVVTLPLALVGSMVMTVLLPGLGEFALPVVIYMLVILTMAMQALERWRRHSHAGARLAGVGALAFLVSDASLGVTRFAGGFSGSRTVVVVMYILAQYLIATSSGVRAAARAKRA
jgi:uncharacterized membrane protein YhhN